MCGSSISAWPSLDSATSLSTPSSSLGGGSGGSSGLGGNSHVSNTWLTLAKQQTEQQMTRSKRYQDAPVPWVPVTTSISTASTAKLSDEDMGECEEAMPAPLFRESFFSAIDESLKLIETSKCEN